MPKDYSQPIIPAKGSLRARMANCFKMETLPISGGPGAYVGGVLGKLIAMMRGKDVAQEEVKN